MWKKKKRLVGAGAGAGGSGIRDGWPFCFGK